MRLVVEAAANGRVRNADITAFDDDGNVRFTDSANLSSAANRRRVARSCAEQFGEDASKLEAALNEKWNEAVTRRRQTKTSPKPTPQPTRQDAHLTDLGNAQRFAARHGQRFRHCHPWGKDLHWDGVRWAQDDNAEIERLAKDTVRSIYQEGLNHPDDKERARLIGHALKSEEAKRIRAMISLARSEPKIPVLPRELDRDPWLLNATNCVIDLRTGQTRDHRQDDMITKVCPTHYDPKAKCPLWERFLTMVFPGGDSSETGGDDELITFVQRLFGMCLTGDVSENVLPIFWGVGQNGKSTLINAILEVMGSDYAIKAPADFLMARRGAHHPTELTDLHGKRLMAASESDQGRRLNEGLIKELTGRERIRARRMREDFWEFTPTHKVILQTNHKPRVKGTDVGIWRRLRLIPFEVQFWDPADPRNHKKALPEGLKADKQLPDKLKGEYPGVLTWLVRGCLDWQRDGLTMPGRVRVATAEYQSSEDLIGQFLSECCLVNLDDPALRVRASVIYQRYRKWCEDQGEEPWKQKTFGDSMSERNFKRVQNNGIWYIGVLVRDDHGRTE